MTALLPSLRFLQLLPRHTEEAFLREDERIDAALQIFPPKEQPEPATTPARRRTAGSMDFRTALRMIPILPAAPSEAALIALLPCPLSP